MTEQLILMIIAVIAIIGAAALIYGAISMFAFAADQGFIGLAVYFACWVFLLPIMLTASVIVGLIGLYICY